MNMDKDLVSIQEVRSLIPDALAAFEEFRRFSPEKINEICKKVADTAYREAVNLAKMAVEETGMGKYEDKITKNQFASRDLWTAIKDMKTLGILNEDKRRKVIEVGEPKGIVAAIIPTTNPTSTAIYKTLISLKSGNAVIGSPHPSAAACTRHTFDLLRQAAEEAGAPEGLISCIKTPSIEGATTLIKDPRIAVILATGGPGIVKAAYSSGNPALGVGAGNTPVYIEQSADIEKAVRDVVTGKSFDNGLICSSEQTLICDKKIYDRVRKGLEENRAYIVDKKEKEQLQATMTIQGHLNTKIVGKSAEAIAAMAGFDVPRGTRILVADVSAIGASEPLTMEKLSPVLALIAVDNSHTAIQRALEVTRFGGMGHTAAIHTSDTNLALEYGLKCLTSRVVVNSPAVHGAVGNTTGLLPSLTLGCGARGNNSISDNVGPAHLVDIKRIAWETVPANPTAGKKAYLDEGSGIKGNYSRFDQEPAPSKKNVETFGNSGLTGSQIDDIIDKFRKRK